MIEWISTFLESNQIASGGLLVVLVSSFGYAVRAVPHRIANALYRRFVLSVEVLDNDESFGWLASWLGQHAYAVKGRRMSVSTRPNNLAIPQSGSSSDPVAGSDLAERAGASRRVRYVPSPGWHLLRACGAWFVLVRHRTDPSSTRATQRFERFVLYTLSCNRGALGRLFDEARRVAYPLGDSSIGMYNGSWSWAHLSEVPLRPIDTVILPNGLEHTILRDVEEFLARRVWYEERSIPYRRGYLLCGPPGNGKTSLIVAIASALKMHIGILSISNPDLDDARLLHLLAVAARYNIIVVIEDVDALGLERNGRKDRSMLTFSGFLNAIDGVASPSGQLIFMTTNHRRNLDAALCRPGRVDVDVEVGNATPDQISRLACRILGPRSNWQELRELVVQNLIVMSGEGSGISMAYVQQELMSCAGQGSKSFALSDERSN